MPETNLNSKPSIDVPRTELTRRRYNRLAAIYDRSEGLIERMALARWRSLLWSRVNGPRVLEVGVGTGKNLPYYPPQCQVTAIDLSPNMLDRARRRAQEMSQAVDLRVMDAQSMAFPDASFDTVVATCVFCSVPDPMLGLMEVRRVCRAGGQVLLLEHVLSSFPPMRLMMRLLNPLAVRLGGENIDRETILNVQRAGLEVVSVTDLFGDVFKLIEARP